MIPPYDDLPSLNHTISQDLKEIEKWSMENKMLINNKKTKSMLVVGKRLRKRSPIDIPTLDIYLNESKIEQVLNYKLLGVNLDQDLTYEAHID